MRVNWNLIKILSLLIATGLLYAFASHRNSKRLVADVKVQFDDESQPFVTREAVNKLLIQSKEPVTKSTKEKLALKEMETRLNTHPLIKNAEVYVNMDGTLGVAVKQREPIARLKDSTSFYIGAEGEVMPLSSSFSARVPLVTGVSKGDVKEVYELISFVQEDAFLEKHIVGITKKENGDFVLTPRSYDYKIVLGAVGKLPLKFNNYKAFYKKAYSDKTLDRYDLITLKYDNQVVCSKKEQ